MTALLPPGDSHAEARARLRCAIPARGSIAEDTRERRVGSGCIALVHLHDDGAAERITVDDLHHRDGLLRFVTAVWAEDPARTHHESG